MKDYSDTKHSGSMNKDHASRIPSSKVSSEPYYNTSSRTIAGLKIKAEKTWPLEALLLALKAPEIDIAMLGVRLSSTIGDNEVVDQAGHQTGYEAEGQVGARKK